MEDKKEEYVYESIFPKWFVYLIAVILLLSILVEMIFLSMFSYSCIIHKQCITPYFFGMGRYMIFPLAGYSYTSISSQSSSPVCSVNGQFINCSGGSYGYTDS